MENVDWKNTYKLIWFFVLLIIGMEYFGGRELFEFVIYLWTCNHILQHIDDGDNK